MSPELSEVVWSTVNQILVLIISGVGAYFISRLAKWANAKWMKVEVEIEQSQYYVIYNVVRQFVMAAQGMGFWDAALKAGVDKKNWVLTMAEAALYERGIHIEVVELSAMIEDIVFSEFKREFGPDPMLE